MKRLLPVVLVTITAFGSNLASAQSEQPTAKDADAFIDAYMMMTPSRLLLEEYTALQVESGRMSPKMAACIKQNAPYDRIHKPIEDVVLKSFTNASDLRASTAFFASPTGQKLNQHNLTTFKAAIKRRLRGLPPPKSGQPNFSPEDLKVIDKFDNSPAGAAFTRFVVEGLPQIQRINLLKMAQDVCGK